MLACLADENFNGRILRALGRRIESFDVVRVQDTDLYGADDPTVLAGAARLGRILLTHDVATLVGHAYDRMARGQAVPGVLAVSSNHPMGPIVDDLELLILGCEPEEITQRVVFVPL